MPKTMVKKKKAAVVKKKKAAVSDKEILAALEEVEERGRVRYKWALEVMKFQDEATQVAINRMTAKMAQMAGEPTFFFKERSYTDDQPRLRDIQYRSHLWIAVRLLVACAEWDIRIANFKLPKGRCAKCGKKVK